MPATQLRKAVCDLRLKQEWAWRKAIGRRQVWGYFAARLSWGYFCREAASKEAKIPQPLLLGEYWNQKLKPLFAETKTTFSLEAGRKRETETKN